MKKILKHLIFWFSMLGTAAAVLYFFIADIPLYIKIICGALLLFMIYEVISDRKREKKEEMESHS
ncbi:hypothetical protein [Bacillus massiliglaciei]|uniref:hypothetical protein n=1 Tax=Bacillus massiliglaciei TaxID=1816693 RepID=UPI000DA6332E|nr:hypothetical protein [Bacillus massiliglaciei]